MTSRYQQLKMEFGGEEAAVESLREALKYARRAVARGDKVTHPDVVMLLDVFEMESGHETAPEPEKGIPLNSEAMRLRRELNVMNDLHKEGARRLNQRIAELEEEVRIRSNALTTRITQVAGLQADLESAGKRIEELARANRDWEQRWSQTTDSADRWLGENRKLREEVRQLRKGSTAVQSEELTRANAELGRMRAELARLQESQSQWAGRVVSSEVRLSKQAGALRQQQALLDAQELQLETQAAALKKAETGSGGAKAQIASLKTELIRTQEQLATWRKYGVLADIAKGSTTDKFASVLNASVPFFARKNEEYGNAIESTGVRGSVVALTGDVARLRVMLQQPTLDTGNIRDKLQDVLVQAGIGIVLLDADNVDGKGV